MDNIFIKEKSYRFISHYKHDDEIRGDFNSLVQKMYHFDFENWYKSGYWQDNCMLYSLLHNEKVVSHITVNVIDFIVLGKKKQFVQLGTVMTDEHYRHQGLSRALMEKVLNEWESKCDLIYLFANDSVIDFYPMFGFVPVNEYEASKRVSKISNSYPVRKMDIDNISDLKLLYETTKNAVSLFKISMQDNAGLVMFYCNYFELFSFKENLYYIENLNAIVVAAYEENTLILYDIFAIREIEIDDVINALAMEQTTSVTLQFMPTNCEDYELSLFKEEDSTLMVMANKSELFEDNKLMFPMLSHT
ncbi:GNAT family N-acetyltransferase [Psychrobacillus sp.]|uniref:GNAT family N-acetyltransferase n=1 Tax=Psychrobacillus sp. TaxID=1871623 RepID=UPI0028BDB309|nr:GNAT family N-acetyltransferase [Psychrobacillus sp.]